MATIITLDGGDAIVTVDGATVVDTRSWHDSPAAAIAAVTDGTAAAIGRLVGETPQSWYAYSTKRRTPTATKLEDWCESADVRLELGPKGWRAWRL